MADKYDIKVLLDVHALKGSQNPFDNSGRCQDLEWTDSNNFVHWPISASYWMGKWNRQTNRYDSIDHHNINRSLAINTKLVQRWRHHPSFHAFEPVNEPWAQS